MKKFKILIPLYNDWKSVSKLLEKIDFEVNNWDVEVSVVIINDGSTEERSGLDFNYLKIKSIKIINMKLNRASARAIGSGLKYIYENEDFDHVIVMDADGEDRPEELNDFLKKSIKNPEMTITGNRFKRSEGIVFIFFYQIHKLLTFIFTGKMIKFGNFTCLPKEHVAELIKNSNIWNAYSSTVVKVIKNRTSILSIRGFRYVQPSKMNFFSLVFHSLSIISVFRKEVISRSIVFFLFYLFLIFNNISVLTLIPIFLLILFVLMLLKISKRANMEELNNSLRNIGSIKVL
tara:strand:- start:678 stop:1547 length:870 start_codon:yes stop_codon:yes gene_type:complete